MISSSAEKIVAWKASLGYNPGTTWPDCCPDSEEPWNDIFPGVAKETSLENVAGAQYKILVYATIEGMMPEIHFPKDDGHRTGGNVYRGVIEIDKAGTMKLESHALFLKGKLQHTVSSQEDQDHVEDEDAQMDEVFRGCSFVFNSGDAQTCYPQGDGDFDDDLYKFQDVGGDGTEWEHFELGDNNDAQITIYRFTERLLLHSGGCDCDERKGRRVEQAPTRCAHCGVPTQATFAEPGDIVAWRGNEPDFGADYEDAPWAPNAIFRRTADLPAAEPFKEGDVVAYSKPSADQSRRWWWPGILVKHGEQGLRAEFFASTELSPVMNDENLPVILRAFTMIGLSIRSIYM